MSKKIVFVILWLTLSFSVLAQAPARTTPATNDSQESKPCWEQEIKNMADGASCYRAFVDELKRQKGNAGALENLEVAGVRFLKANGYSDEAAANMVASQIKNLEASEQTRTTPDVAVKPTPPPVVSFPQTPQPNSTIQTATEETQEQKENRELREKLADFEKLMARDTVIKRRAEEIDAQRRREEAEKKLRKTKDEDPSTRKARKEFEKREKQEREAKRRFAEAVGNANISCTDPTRVSQVVIRSTQHLLFNSWQAYQRVVITNPYPYTLQVSAIDPAKQKSGPQVDLPGFCTITLTRSLLISNGETNPSGGGVSYSYVAQAVDMQNYKGTARSWPFSLYPGNGYRQAKADPWVIGNFQMY